MKQTKGEVKQKKHSRMVILVPNPEDFWVAISKYLWTNMLCGIPGSEEC